MSNISRRKFLFAGASVSAVAGLGYLIKDHWLPQQKQIVTPPTTSTPIISESSQSTITETPTPTLTETTMSTPVETTTTTQVMTEDEIAVRKLLEEDWVEAFNSEDIQRMLDLYDDNATVTTWMGQYVFGKDRNWSLRGYYEWSAKVNARVHNYKITKLKISGEKAEVSSTFSYFASGAGYNMTVTHQLKLIKITKITKGKVTTKLPKPIWKILYESVSF